MIVGLIGYIGSGKGTVANELVQSYGFRQDSFASSLKDACSAIFGWPRHMLEGDTLESRNWREVVDLWWAEKVGIPNLTPRLALQVIGTDVLRQHFNPDLWFLTLENRIRQNPAQHVVISDVRFPNEIEFIKKQGGTLVRIDRGPVPAWQGTAMLANQGNSLAKETMDTVHSSAHYSEWAWCGTIPNVVLDNNTTIGSLHDQVARMMLTIQ
jgi:hypothetical protein